jgi:hypothetical protein
MRSYGIGHQTNPSLRGQLSGISPPCVCHQRYDSISIIFNPFNVLTILQTAPTIFAIGFSMIKPFLNERTRNKIQIFNHDPKQWKAALLTEIDAEELPACYGGKKTDPDGNPNCATLASPVL